MEEMIWDMCDIHGIYWFNPSTLYPRCPYCRDTNYQRPEEPEIEEEEVEE